MTAPDTSSWSPISGQAYAARLRQFVRLGEFLIVAGGAAVTLGWVFNIAPLKSVLPGLATMKINTAIGFLVAGLSLWLVQAERPKSASHLGRILALLVMALGALTLVQYLFNLDLGLDEAILRDDGLAGGISPPGRMSPATAFNFMLIGLALLCLKLDRPRFAACSHWLIVPPLFIATLAIFGYCYGVRSLYQIGPFTSTALHTAVLFFLLSLCILAADTKHGFALIATSDTAGGLISRTLLPTIPVILFVIGYLRLIAQQAGYFGLEFGLALMVLLASAVCVIAVSWTAIVLHRVDIARAQAEGEIKHLNAGLERRVLERTRQLAELSEKLGAANKALEQLSHHDALTGVANRRRFDAYLEGQIGVAHRYGRQLALVMCDIDAFKLYNDRYGHQAGDECLQKVATALSTCCRRPADLMARYGGEEFAIILPDTDLNGALKIAESARNAVGNLDIGHASSRAGPTISVSGGVAATRGADGNAEQLIMAADNALYEAKRQGGNRIVAAPAGVAAMPDITKTYRAAS